MKKVDQPYGLRKSIVLCVVLLNAIILERGITVGATAYAWLQLTLPLLVLAVLFSRGGKRMNRRKRATHFITSNKSNA